ncbi:siderophore-iron reductase FhuF [Chromobacterium sp. CV08]|uniref:siderophore-iron reductase FhuF n=1 Tax=Chromobacterium sp. CV08 TaxID=3133274 RepID=UPI003DA9FCD2
MELNALLSGELAPYREAWRVGRSAAALPLSALIDGSRLPEALAALERSHPGAPRRAQVSQWAKHYLRLLLPMAVAGAVAGLAMPLAPARIGLLLGGDGLPAALEVDHLGLPQPDADLAERYRPLLAEHLPPLLERLAEHGKLSRRVLWNSAGNLIEHLLQHWREDGLTAAAVHADWLFLPRRRNDGGHNLLWQPVRYVESFLPPVPSPVRLRRLCCLRYELPGEVCCATCPLLPNKSEEELHALLRRWRAAES